MTNWLIDLIKNLFSRGGDNKPDDWRDGLQPSPVDFRDISATEILGSIELSPLPENYRIPYLLPIKDQGTTSTCVGQSCASIKDEKERREKNDVEFDGSWIYNKCKEIDNYSGKGTYFRTGLQILKTLGAKPTASSPIQASPATFKIGGYARVDCDWESLKRAIYQWGAVLGGFYLYPGSFSSAYIKKGNEIVGGHATVLIGWDKNYLIGQNSFSESWGDKGYFYVPKDYLPFEAYAVLSDIPSELLPDTDAKPKIIFQRDLYQELNNDDVVALQDCLKWLGCMTKTQKSTGYFGPVTLVAVKIFQQRYGINPVNGRVGPLTKGKLNELFA
jgi:peptidoglycan hydrolase-like protein with peptidoglycan-binding domain